MRLRKRATTAAAALLALLLAAVVLGLRNGGTQPSDGSEPRVRQTTGRSACDRPYAAWSPWNTPIVGAPVDTERAAVLADLGQALTSDPTQYTYPVYQATVATPRKRLEIEGWFSDVGGGGRTLRLQRGGSVSLPVPAGAKPAPGSDGQVIIHDPATGDEWGAWRFDARSDGSVRATNAYHYDTAWSGVPPRTASGDPFVSRGAGVPYLAGLVRPCEIERGSIDHALAFAYPYPSAEHVYPATKSDGLGSADDLAEGTRLQLDPALGRDEIRGWGCDGACLTIARALQRYGMYVIDNGGRPKLMMESEDTAHWNGTVTASTPSPIRLASLRVVVDAAPTVQALPSGGRRGGRVALRYRVFDAGGGTRERIVVRAEGAAASIVRRPLHTQSAPSVATVAWAAPAGARSARFCVRAWDAAGRSSGESCGPVRLR